MNLDSLRPNTRLQRGIALLTIGLVIVVSTVWVGVATTPNSVGGVGDADKTTLVGIQGNGFAWHTGGKVVAFNNSTGDAMNVGVDSYFDVTPAGEDRLIAAFAHNDYQNCGPYEPPCTRTGYRVIDRTPSPHVVEQYSYPVRTPHNSEVHDIEPLPSGEVLIADMEHERLVAVKNGSVTWQWNASSVYEAPADATERDWLHINDIDVIEEGRYLVSVRNANQLLVVSRSEGVVEIINEDRSDKNDVVCLGRGQLVDANDDEDVRCGPPDVLDHQHNPQWLGNGTVLVADSENHRVVQLHRGENGTWRPGWTLHSANGVEFFWPRDADRLRNGNTLITDTLNRRVVEVTPSGEVVWSVRTEGVPYEADRLPAAERSRGVRYQQSVTVPQNVNREYPVLSSLIRGLRIAHPPAPLWFTELQILGVLCAIPFLARGALDVFQASRR